ncbi:P-loop NTPase [archaeon]|jgi:MinD superfamily P-loop ATPase|nr:P-loop NTPase [archaeon]MBT6869273.1 P-loop NTPase [archaeon]MBT7193671.1 P-loop NTPase [archaeon]MBT7381217.1 P-loop NTPase [archaeon]MBT7508534.1 P-loop NTPase [archaeon]
MKKITILSGKGGVGKSSILASLAITISKEKKIICADCDVDASNLALVLGAEKQEEWENLTTNKEAVFDLTKCNSCKKCFEECYFKAIGWKDDKPYLKNFSCEGCGTCQIVCPQNAISLKEINNAKMGYSNTRYKFKVVSGQLNVGSSGSGKVVFKVRKKAEELFNNCDLMLIDSAAGIGCPVIASVSGTDHAIIITEPTPSGISDMKRAFKVVKHFKIPCSIIINKWDINEINSGKIEEFANSKNICIISKIPFDKKFAKALTKMIPIIILDKNYEKIFLDIKEKLFKEIYINGKI